EVVLADRVDGRVERDDHEPDAGPEQPLAPPRDGPATAGKRPGSAPVEERRHHGRDDLERLEAPRVLDHVGRLEPCTSSTTTWSPRSCGTWKRGTSANSDSAWLRGTGGSATTTWRWSPASAGTSSTPTASSSG